MTKTTYTISEANRITGKSRTTITKHLDEGKLSSMADDDGNRLIEASELMRVYGDDLDFDRALPPGKRRKGGQGRQASRGDNNATNQNGAGALQQQLEREIEERQRERAQYEQQIEHLKDSLKLAQEGQNKVTRLLEDRSESTGEWERSLQRMEERLVNVEQRSQQEQKKLQETLVRYKRAYEKEKSKTWLQKILN